MTYPNVSDDSAWYVVQTKPQQEFRALAQLTNQSYSCFLPTLLAKKLDRGELTYKTEPLFSRYLFISLNTVDSNWAPIRSTRGVHKLVAFSNRFPTLPNNYIEALRTAPQNQEAPIEPGESVAIVSGPLAGLEGVFEMPDGALRALVLVQFMSRPQKVTVDIEAISKMR